MSLRRLNPGDDMRFVDGIPEHLVFVRPFHNVHSRIETRRPSWLITRAFNIPVGFYEVQFHYIHRPCAPASRQERRSLGASRSRSRHENYLHETPDVST